MKGVKYSKAQLPLRPGRKSSSVSVFGSPNSKIHLSPTGLLLAVLLNLLSTAGEPPHTLKHSQAQTPTRQPMGGRRAQRQSGSNDSLQRGQRFADVCVINYLRQSIGLREMQQHVGKHHGRVRPKHGTEKNSTATLTVRALGLIQK